MSQSVRQDIGRVADGQSIPHLGLVCTTFCAECRYLTIGRRAFLKLDAEAREYTLRELYWQNLGRLNWAMFFCARNDIQFYRLSPDLFPMCHEPAGQAVLEEMEAMLSAVGRRSRRLGIRLVVHPDPRLKLNSPHPEAARRGRAILEAHARAFDLMGLPRSAWSAIIIHGGHPGRGEALAEAIGQLSPGLRQRLCLENDESACSAEQIFDVCRAAQVPMVFDCHHHLIREGLDSYEHPSVAHWTAMAAATWPEARWQIVHLSNGQTAPADVRHSHLIAHVPSAYARVPWIEVEAKGKERAIAALCQKWPALATRKRASAEG